ncbi:uncharacterized protein LOC132751159 [Ruditapes philippinarum]|uniref:uncharacterized protein LOC132751159 n=1 Tax=Ruditapes philippinarum TaxID=129788 RepID=UPI00295AA217|nr:uncharacterized protein LOC132751159 [Ruditapes philippinarum]
MESLTLSLKDVQKAKCNLESRLNEKRRSRKNIENVLETVNSKLTQIKNIHTKMTETLKIAQHKVAQTQAQSDSMEKSNGEKRQALQSVNQQIKHLQDSRTNEIHKFEEELSKMAKQMVNSKDAYTDKNLLVKIAGRKSEYEQLLQKSRKLEQEKVNMSQRYQELEQKSTPEIVDEDIDRQAVMDVFTEEHNDNVKNLVKLKEELKVTRNNQG